MYIVSILLIFVAMIPVALYLYWAGAMAGMYYATTGQKPPGSLPGEFFLMFEIPPILAIWLAIALFYKQCGKIRTSIS